MLKNELDLVKKIISDKSPEVLSEIIKFHLFAQGTGLNYKNKMVAYRNIKVKVNEVGIYFEYIPGTYYDENVIPKAVSLMYKNCPSDTTGPKRYLFGDIRVKIKELNTKENFIKKITSPISSDTSIPGEIIKFKEYFWNNFDFLWDYIQREHTEILKDPIKEGFKNDKNYQDLFIHFDCSELIGHDQWYMLNNAIESLDLNEIALTKKETFSFCPNGNYSPKKKFFHTLCSGDEKNDNQFFSFDENQRFKSFSLAEGELRYIFYYQKILNSCKISIPFSLPYSMRIIPVGDYFADQALDFFTKLGNTNVSQADEIESAEEQIQVTDIDPFDIFSDMVECSNSITSFDIIFLKTGVQGPDTNISEINNISRSSLRNISKNINSKISLIRAEMKMSDKQKLSVTGSFYDLYKNTGKHEKYQLKLIRMLLKLYSNAYYGDQDLDNIFCETAFRDIRDGYLSNYRNHLRSYKLLKIISKEKNMLKTEKQIEEENKSCELGIALAQVAWPLNSAITSFTRSVVGLMKLRISNVKPIDSIDKLFVEIRDKVRMHTGEKAGNKEVILDGVAATKVNELLNDFRTKNLKFHKYLFLRSFGTIYDQKVYFSNKD